MYFYENLFQLSPDSKIINNRKLTKNTTSKSLNETFILDRADNKEKMEACAEESDIKFN